MSLSLLPDISVAVMIVTVLVCVALLTESRLSERATWAWTIGVGVAALIANQVARELLSTISSTQAIAFTVIVPYVLLFWWISPLRRGRVAFTVCMATALIFVPSYLGYVLDHHVLTPMGLPYGVSRTVVRSAACVLMLAATLRFRASYRAVLRSWDRGWWRSAAIAALLCVEQLLVDTSIDHDAPWPGSYPAVVVLWAVVLLVFGAILYSLADQLRLAETATSELDALAAQEALRERMELGDAADGQLTAEQEELAARLAEFSALLAAGETDAARALLHDADAALAATRVRRWCANPVYDAVIGAYLRRAEALGVALDVRAELPGDLALNATELSCVLGNALENALHALAEVPQAERRLQLRCVCWPQLMLQVGNSCAGDVAFGPDGLPIASAAGHGLGTRSIAAYCAKYGAALDYACEDGWFSMTLVQELF